MTNFFAELSVLAIWTYKVLIISFSVCIVSWMCIEKLGVVLNVLIDTFGKQGTIALIALTQNIKQRKEQDGSGL